MTPQEFIGDKVEYDSDGIIIWGMRREFQQHILDVRGWGAIQHLFKTEKEAANFQDELGQWIVDAINQKLSGQSSKDKERIAELTAEVERLRGLVEEAFDYARDNRFSTHPSMMWNQFKAKHNL